LRIEKQRASGRAVQVVSARFTRLRACGRKRRGPLAIVATAKAPERLLVMQLEVGSEDVT
jgi:hypothetical protein